jgi:hypothetical protein
LCFIDLGSGIGSVVLAMHTIVANNVTTIVGVETCKEFCERFVEWVDEICADSPRILGVT